MLSEEEIREIEAEFPNYAEKMALCIDALRIVQHHRGGWVSDESLHDLAEYLHMSLEDLDGVATFYNLIFRQPVGKHVVRLCNSVSCYVMGSEKIRQYFKEKMNLKFGQTSADGNFTLLPIACLGMCDHAPAMMVDEDTYGDLTPDKIKDILATYLRGGA
jgi:NADH-quinone oxidoreductase subunit E